MYLQIHKEHIWKSISTPLKYTYITEYHCFIYKECDLGRSSAIYVCWRWKKFKIQVAAEPDVHMLLNTVLKNDVHALYLLIQTSKFFGHKVHRKDLIDPTYTTWINLTILHCSCLKKLLEHDTITTHLSCSDSNPQWLQGLQYRRFIS